MALLQGAAGLIKMDGGKVLKRQARADTGELALFMSLRCESALSQTLIAATRSSFNLQHSLGAEAVERQCRYCLHLSTAVYRRSPT